MNVLIPAQPNDMHAHLVKRALETLGHAVAINFGQTNIDYDVVWWRSACQSILSNNAGCNVMESSCMYDAKDLATKAWWINSKKATSMINFKVLQLKIISECELNIPTTLCSNDPNEISRFCLKYQKQGVTHIPQDLSLAPGIFQKDVEKKYSIHVTCFGDHLVAVKRISSVKFEPYMLPHELVFKIRACMREFGMVFGTFDFSVTSTKEYIFRDVSNCSQFLWIEQCNPTFKMLDMFVNFITSKSIS